jgi:hypothetical protein
MKEKKSKRLVLDKFKVGDKVMSRHFRKGEIRVIYGFHPEKDKAYLTSVTGNARYGKGYKITHLKQVGGEPNDTLKGLLND